MKNDNNDSRSKISLGDIDASGRDWAVMAPAKYFSIVLEQMRETERRCGNCGMRNSLDNQKKCTRCGDMVCSICVIDEPRRIRRCTCGGEIEE